MIVTFCQSLAGLVLARGSANDEPLLVIRSDGFGSLQLAAGRSFGSSIRLPHDGLASGAAREQH